MSFFYAFQDLIIMHLFTIEQYFNATQTTYKFAINDLKCEGLIAAESLLQSRFEFKPEVDYETGISSDSKNTGIKDQLIVKNKANSVLIFDLLVNQEKDQFTFNGVGSTNRYIGFYIKNQNHSLIELATDQNVTKEVMERIKPLIQSTLDYAFADLKTNQMIPDIATYNDDNLLTHPFYQALIQINTIRTKDQKNSDYDFFLDNLRKPKPGESTFDVLCKKYIDMNLIPTKYVNFIAETINFDSMEKDSQCDEALGSTNYSTLAK